MLKERELKNAGAGRFAWAALQDATQRNRNCAATYSSAQRSEAQRIVDILDIGYKFDESFINYRKKFIAVKISSPVSRGPAAAKLVAELLSERGVERVTTAQGIVVRILKV